MDTQVRKLTIKNGGFKTSFHPVLPLAATRAKLVTPSADCRILT